MPFRSWCKSCVWGKGVAGDHKKQEESRRNGRPIIDVDYMGKKRKDRDKEEEEWGPGEQRNPIIVMRDRESKYTFASVVPKKGADEFAIKRMGQDLEYLG